MIPPKIPHLLTHVATLSRRLAHLDERVTNPPNANYATGGAREHDQREIEALTAALQALEYVRIEQGHERKRPS